MASPPTSRWLAEVRFLSRNIQADAILHLLTYYPEAAADLVREA